jgi:hypothetical protein
MISESPDMAVNGDARQFTIQQLCPSADKACGIAVFAQSLEEAFLRNGVLVKTVASYDAICPGVLLVQHEFGIFNSATLTDALKRHEGTIILLAHCPGAEVFSEHVNAYVALCNGVVKTRKPLLVLPHPGWQQPLMDRAKLKAQYGWHDFRCVVGTNGFISPTRQFDEIIEKMIAFAAEHNVLMHIVCPRHANHDNRPGYRDQEERLRLLAAQYPRNIELERRFLDHNSLNQRLQACDLLWCWTATPSGPYGSGTCSDQYASGSRLVVTNKQQHSHVLGLPNVVAAPTDIQCFVETLMKEALADNYERHDPSRLSWDTFAQRLCRFIDKLATRNAGWSTTVSQGRFANGSGTSLAVDSMHSRDELTVETASRAADVYLSTLSAYPERFLGQGVVICAGGGKYNICAWVLIRLLRALNCSLPIEVWCYEQEYDADWSKLVEQWNVTVRRATDRPEGARSRWVGWALKSYALLHSRFKEVLLLDADNVPVRDPSYLFNQPEYRSKGAAFWPDKFRSIRGTEQWQVFGVPYRNEMELESGQLLVNKEMGWTALNLCVWYNHHSDFFYRHIYGDKDTFRFAWHKTNSSFAMPSTGLRMEPGLILQHDFAGEVLFQHRYQDKWGSRKPRHIPGFVHEELCMQYIDELRGQWNGGPRSWDDEVMATDANAQALIGRRFSAHRLGHSCWNLRLGRGGIVDEGCTTDVEAWWMEAERLVLGTKQGDGTFYLERTAGGDWKGSGSGNCIFKLTAHSRASPAPTADQPERNGTHEHLRQGKHSVAPAADRARQPSRIGRHVEPPRPTALPKVFCITLRQTPDRTRLAKKHFEEMGIPVEFFFGIHAKTFGLKPELPSTKIKDYFISQGYLGTLLSHYTLWNTLTHLPYEEVLVLEDDAYVSPSFSEEFMQAYSELPDDWDLVYVGSCCTDGKKTRRISTRIAQVEYPLCLHGLLIRRRALPILIATNQVARDHLDIQLEQRTLSKLNHYCFIPPLVRQRTLDGAWKGIAHDLDCEAFESDPTCEDIYRDEIDRCTFGDFVEVGEPSERSAAFLGQQIRLAGKPLRAFCVGVFGDRRPVGLEHSASRCEEQRSFREKLARCGVFEDVELIVEDPVLAAGRFQEGSVHCLLIRDRTGESLSRILTAWSPKMKAGGLMLVRNSTLPPIEPSFSAGQGWQREGQLWRRRL